MVHTWVSGSSATASTLRNGTAYAKPAYAGRTAPQAPARSHRGLGIARSFFILFAFLILFSGFAFAHTFASDAEVSPATATEISISVDSGDTIWDLAASYKKDTMDTRDAVHAIKKRNGLSSSSVQAGQTLILPAKMLP
ncbi:LysM peptidoglycan-binding domain-containing protein [Cohnella sp. GCM10027633]|uniref:cell division suppressor protein YneA n=1 Tax=unclassified Cohnella TaxID=2636738 RepID=UPI00362BC107